jgi:CheY-like chemotaxis protein
MTDKIKVLAIDDEGDFCYFVKKNLMQTGLFEVFVTTSGVEGIKLAREEEPDIILLDLFMPDMPGEDVAADLQENPSTADIPILYVTALVSNSDIIEGEINKIGKHYVLPKPISTKKLIDTIVKILGTA